MSNNRWQTDAVGCTLTSPMGAVYRMDHNPEKLPALEAYLEWCRWIMKTSEERPRWMLSDGTIDRSELFTISDCCEASQVDSTICPLCGLVKRIEEGECATCFAYSDCDSPPGR